MSDTTITVESLLKALPYTERGRNPVFDSIRNPLTYMGMPILEVDPDIRPVLSIREDVPCTPAVRREVNAWLLEMFGTRDYSPFARGRALVLSGYGLMIRKDDAAAVLLTNYT